MNDFIGINWKKVSKYMGEFYTVSEDRLILEKKLENSLTQHIR